MEFENKFAKWLYNWLINSGVGHETAIYLKLAILTLALIILAFIVDFVARRILLLIIHQITRKSKTNIDDVLYENKFFHALAHIAPAVLVEFSVEHVFSDFQFLTTTVDIIAKVYIIIVVIILINAILNSLTQLMSSLRNFADKPLNSYAQLGKIINYLVGGILIISVIIDRSPIYMFSALGAMTAVLLLVFKDTILGFVASIQLASNDMVRMGDWITMEKYGADGDVFEMNLTTIKVRNFDNTITTIPTYSFISDSFKNWRGMAESGGRRIKRGINIKASSVKFCTPELLNKLREIELIEEYINARQKEIDDYNEKHKADKAYAVNGRNMTNLGIFRQYVMAYVKANPNINQDMTCMVRQLPTTEKGIPIELYAFSKSKEWAVYEGIMADIFDHLLAAVPSFELEVFQNPTGTDFRALSE